jgi:CheY-like chemotaxis protein
MEKMMAPRKILVVDDEKNQRDILQLILSGERDENGAELYDVKAASSGQEALRYFKNDRFDLVLTDLKMAGMDGIQLLNELSQIDSSTPVILMTAHGSIETVKEALRGGAFDYLEKPLDRAKLLEVISKAVSQMKAVEEEIVGASDVMERVKKMIVKVAGSSSTVLIRGEWVPARNASRAQFTRPARASMNVSRPSTVLRSMKTSSNPNCSVMKKALSPARMPRRKVSLRSQTRGLSSSMKLVRST